MNTQNMLIVNPSLNSLFDAIIALEEAGADMDASLSIAKVATSAATYVLTVPSPAPNKGVKQRCRSKNPAGSRCIKGSRHPGNHRYEQEA